MKRLCLQRFDAGTSAWRMSGRRQAMLGWIAAVLLFAALPASGDPAAVPASVVWSASPPAQVPVKEGFVDVGGARLWYWDTGGDGDPLILLHPWTGSGASWEYQQPVFAQAGYRVIGYSRRGHFRSQRTSHDGEAPVAASEDLRKLVVALQLERFHLIGSAAGSWVALDYALSYPDGLQTMVLASSTLNLQDPQRLEVLKRLIPPNFHSLPADFRELGPSYRAGNPGGTAQWIALEKSSREPGLPPQPSVNRATTEKLAGLSVPVLLMTGDADLYFPHAVALEVVGKAPNAELVLIENAGHAAFWERPEEFNRAILDFIERRGPGTAPGASVRGR